MKESDLDEILELKIQSNENEELIIEKPSEPDKEKNRLVKVLDRIKKDLEEKEKGTIRDVYLSYKK